MELRFVGMRSLSLLALCTGCDILDPGDCVAIGRFALNVIVQDSITGIAQPVMTRVIVRDASYADSVTAMPSQTGSSCGLAPERLGTYFVTVESEGYRRWSRANIVVERSSGKCHELRTATMLARLQR